MATLFLLLAVAALSVMLLRPVCEAAFSHTWPTQHSAACCESVSDGSDLAIADLAPPIPGGNPVFASFAYFNGAASMARAAVAFTTALPPPGSYYSRSARILR
jgi:hypothetical protein